MNDAEWKLRMAEDVGSIKTSVENIEEIMKEHKQKFSEVESHGRALTIHSWLFGLLATVIMGMIGFFVRR